MSCVRAGAVGITAVFFNVRAGAVGITAPDAESAEEEKKEM